MSRGKRYDGDPKLNMRKVFATVIAIIVIIMVIISIRNLFTRERNQEKVVQTAYFTVYDNGKYGVIDNKGETIISLDYDEMIVIPNPTEDVFICTYDVDYKNETYSTKVLNSSGKEILTKYNNVQPIEKFDVNNVWYDENLLIYESDGLYGLVDYEGNQITEAIYTSIYALDGTEKSIVIEQYDKKGIVNSSLKNVVIDCMYDSIEMLTNNSEDEGYITLSNGKYGISSASGKVILENEYDGIKHVSGDSIYAVLNDDVLKIVDDAGDEISEFSYDDITSIDGNNVIVKENDLYGLVSIENEVLIEPKYEELTHSEGDYYIAKENDLYGIISTSDETCIDFSYASLEYIASTNFYQGENSDYKSDIISKDFELKLSDVIISELNPDSNYMRVRNADGEYKYYTLNFEEESNIDALKSNTLFLVKENDMYGYVNSDGELIVDYIYDDAKEQNEYGYCVVKSNGVWGVLAQDGTMILEPSINLDDNLYIEFIDEWHLYEDASLNIYVK